MSKLLTCNAPLILLGELTDAADPRYVETEIDILELVPQEQKGGAGKFHATAAKAAEMVRNHATEAALGYYPPLVIGHPTKTVAGPDGKLVEVPDEGAESVGRVSALRRVGTRLRATVQLVRDFAERVRKGAFSYVSPEFSFAAHNSVGEAIGSKVFRIGVTDVPHQKGADGLPVGAFLLAEMAGATYEDLTMNDQMLAALTARLEALEKKCSEWMEKKGDAPAPPDPEKEKAEEDAELARKAASEALAADVVALKATVETLTTSLATAKDADKALAAKDAEVKTLSQSVAALQQVALAHEITTEIEKGKAGGVFSPAQLKGSDEDPIKWLAESAFCGQVEGLRRHVKTAPKVVDASPSVALPGTPGHKPAAVKAAFTLAEAESAGYKTVEEMTKALTAYDARHGASDESAA